MAREQLQTLTESMYYVLLVLTTPKHGYEMMQEISRLTDGRVKVGAGTLYALLSRFEKDKIIVQVSDDGRRKTYALTEKGRALLLAEYRRLQLLVENGKNYLREDDGIG